MTATVEDKLTEALARLSTLEQQVAAPPPGEAGGFMTSAAWNAREAAAERERIQRAEIEAARRQREAPSMIMRHYGGHGRRHHHLRPSERDWLSSEFAVTAGVFVLVAYAMSIARDLILAGQLDDLHAIAGAVAATFGPVAAAYLGHSYVGNRSRERIVDKELAEAASERRHHHREQPSTNEGVEL